MSKCTLTIPRILEEIARDFPERLAEAELKKPKSKLCQFWKRLQSEKKKALIVPTEAKKTCSYTVSQIFEFIANQFPDHLAEAKKQKPKDKLCAFYTNLQTTTTEDGVNKSTEDGVNKSTEQKLFEEENRRVIAKVRRDSYGTVAFNLIHIYDYLEDHPYDEKNEVKQHIQDAELDKKLFPQIPKSLQPGDVMNWIAQEGFLQPIPSNSRCSGCYIPPDTISNFIRFWCERCYTSNASMLHSHLFYSETKNSLNIFYLEELVTWMRRLANPLSTRFPILIFLSGWEEENDAHSNALFMYFNPKKKSIEIRLFDPHHQIDTSRGDLSNKLISELQSFLPVFVRHVIPGWNVTKMDWGESCPIGLQIHESQLANDEQKCQLRPAGFCASWTAILMLVHVAFPYATVDEIAKDIYNHHKQQIPNIREAIKRFSYNLYLLLYNPNKKSDIACCYDKSVHPSREIYPDETCA